ncbi:hypothetical protein Hanom_Chr03g00268971 [Helianthus anomalus]
MGVHVEEEESVQFPTKDMGDPQSLESGELPPSVNVNQAFNIDLSSFGSNLGVRAHKGKKSKKAMAQKYFVSDQGEPSRRKRKRLEDPLAQIPDPLAPGDFTIAEELENDDSGFLLDLNIRATDVEVIQPTAMGASQVDRALIWKRTPLRRRRW